MQCVYSHVAKLAYSHPFINLCFRLFELLYYFEQHLSL